MPTKWMQSNKKPCRNRCLLCAPSLLFVRLNCIQNCLAVVQHVQQFEAPILDQLLITTCQNGKKTLFAFSDRLYTYRKPLSVARYSATLVIGGCVSRIVCSFKLARG
jgi:hypothetical protein